MESNEVKEINKPGCTFTLLLFIFFYLLIRYVFQIIRFYNWNGTNPLNEEHSFQSLILLLPGIILAVCFSFIATYKTLQSKSYSISMLKYAVFFFLCKSVLDLSQIEYLTQLILLIPKILFYLIFFIYLIKSKHVESYLPTAKRKSKLIHLLAILIFLISVVPIFYYEGRMTYVSKYIPIEGINLNHNELTDGLAVFSPLESWTLDSVYNDSNMIIHEFSENKNTKYYVVSFNESYQSRINFAAMQSEFQILPDTMMVDKVLTKDSVINGNIYLHDVYRINETKDESVYWSFAALYSKDYIKAVIISCFENDSYSNSEKSIGRFLKSVDFNLRERISKK